MEIRNIFTRKKRSYICRRGIRSNNTKETKALLPEHACFGCLEIGCRPWKISCQLKVSSFHSKTDLNGTMFYHVSEMVVGSNGCVVTAPLYVFNRKMNGAKTIIMKGEGFSTNVNSKKYFNKNRMSFEVEKTEVVVEDSYLMVRDTVLKIAKHINK